MANNDDKKKTDESKLEDVNQEFSDDMAAHPAEDGKSDLEKELERVKADYQDLENRFKRALADYQNLEKRVAEGRAELASWASSNLVHKLLPVMNHFERAMEGVSDEERKSGWFKGVEMSVQQLRQVLKDEGLEQIEADGQFDPTLHEAVDTKEGEHDKILEVVERGYRLAGKVVKPTRVIVGRKGDK
jgi:molecular chaperone GrpE